MTEQESIDLEKLKQETQAEKNKCFDYLKSLSRMDSKQLEMCGYRGKSSNEAMGEAFRLYLKRIDKLSDAHYKKYPD